MEGMEIWGSLVQSLPSLPRVEAELRPAPSYVAPPPPFVLEALREDWRMEEGEYEEWWKETIKAAKEGRAEAERRWRLATAAYECEYDFAYKSPHQAKAFIPRLTRNVDVVAQYLRRMLVENQRFFTVVTVSSKLEDVASAAVIERMLQYLVERADLGEKMTQLAKMGLLYGIVAVKVFVAPQKVTHVVVEGGRVRAVERVAYQLKVDIVRPQDLYLDPTGQGKFVIQRLLVDRADLEDYVEMGLLRREAVDKLVSQGAAKVLAMPGVSDRAVTVGKYRPMYCLLEYWGDVWDKEGKVVHRNVWMIWGAPLGADGKETGGYVLLRGPVPNPYWHQSPPFVVASLSPSPTRAVYPKSVADYLVDLQREYTRLVNAMIDGAIFDAVQLFEVNEGLLENPKDLEEIWSGKIVRKRLGEGQAIVPVQLGKMPTAASFMVQLMERYMMEGFGVTETVLGYLSSRGRPTATEVVTARSHAFSSIEEMGRLLEDNFIEPLLQKLFQVAMQVLPELADEEMLRALGDMSPTLQRMVAMAPTEREALVRGGYRFRVRGMSMMMTKAQELARINEFLQIAASIPQFAQRVNWEGLLMKVVESYGWSPEEVLISPEEVQRQLAVQQLAAQQEGEGQAMMPLSSEFQQQATGQTIEPGSLADLSGAL